VFIFLLKKACQTNSFLPFCLFVFLSASIQRQATHKLKSQDAETSMEDAIKNTENAM
jgi:hypothetical protein